MRICSNPGPNIIQYVKYGIKKKENVEFERLKCIQFQTKKEIKFAYNKVIQQKQNGIGSNVIHEYIEWH